MTQFPFRNLILNGGGVRTFVFHGSLEVLEREGLLEPIERVAGTSAGALLATLLSFRRPVAETLAIYASVDMTRVPQTNVDERILGWIERVPSVKDTVLRLAGNADALTSFFTKFGWYRLDYGYEWLKTVIAERCDGNGMATFAEFQERGFRELYVTATNVSQVRPMVFSAETTPQVAVADALLMSQALPLFFQAVRFDGETIGQGDFYVDGGLFSGYPIEMFDEPRYVFDPQHFIGGVNHETLGLYQFDFRKKGDAIRPITNFWHYIENLSQVLFANQDVALAHSPVNLQRTVNISCLGVGWVDFNIHPVPENEKYLELCAEGRETTEEFLAGYAFGVS